MSLEDVLNWIEGIMNFCLYAMAVAAVIVVVGFTAGYFTERFAVEVREVRPARCLNSACDQTCKPNGRFVRHQGCEK